MATIDPIRSAAADYEIELGLRELMSSACRATRAGHAYVFVWFSGHVQSLSVSAEPLGTDYQDVHRVTRKLIDIRIYLDDDPRSVMDEIAKALDAIDALGDTK